MSIRATEKHLKSSREQKSHEARAFERSDDRIIEWSFEDELIFSYVPKSRIYSQFTLGNKTQQKILFRIDASAPELYTIFQDKFILNAFENKSVKIYMKASGFSYQARLKDKFIFRAIYFNERDSNNFQEDTLEEFFERQFKNKSEFPFSRTFGLKVVERSLENLTNSNMEHRLTPKHEPSPIENSEEFEFLKRRLDAPGWPENVTPKTFSKNKNSALEQSTTLMERGRPSEENEMESYSSYEFQRSTPKMGGARKIANKSNESSRKFDPIDTKNLKYDLKTMREDTSAGRYRENEYKNSRSQGQYDMRANSMEDLDFLNKLSTSPLVIKSSNLLGKSQAGNGNVYESQSARMRPENSINLKAPDEQFKLLEKSKKTQYQGHPEVHDSSLTIAPKEKNSSSATFRLPADRRQFSPSQSPHLRSPLNRSLTPSKRIFDPINSNLGNDMRFEWKEIKENLLEPKMAGQHSRSVSRKESIELKKSSVLAVDFYTNQAEVELSRKSIDRPANSELVRQTSATSTIIREVAELGMNHESRQHNNSAQAMESSFFSVLEGNHSNIVADHLGGKTLKVLAESAALDKEDKRNKKMIFEPMKVPYKAELEELAKKEKENQKKIEALKIENKETEKQLQKVSFLKEFERSEQEKLLRLKNGWRFHFWQIMLISVVFFLAGFFREEIYLYVLNKYRIKYES